MATRRASFSRPLFVACCLLLSSNHAFAESATTTPTKEGIRIALLHKQEIRTGITNRDIEESPLMAPFLIQQRSVDLSEEIGSNTAAPPPFDDAPVDSLAAAAASNEHQEEPITPKREEGRPRRFSLDFDLFSGQILYLGPGTSNVNSEYLQFYGGHIDGIIVSQPDESRWTSISDYYKVSAFLQYSTRSGRSRFVMRLFHEERGIDTRLINPLPAWLFWQWNLQSGGFLRVGRFPQSFGLFDELRLSSAFPGVRPPHYFYGVAQLQNHYIDGLRYQWLSENDRLSVDLAYGRWKVRQHRAGNRTIGQQGRSSEGQAEGAVGSISLNLTRQQFKFSVRKYGVEKMEGFTFGNTASVQDLAFSYAFSTEHVDVNAEYRDEAWDGFFFQVLGNQRNRSEIWYTAVTFHLPRQIETVVGTEQYHRTYDTIPSVAQMPEPILRQHFPMKLGERTWLAIEKKLNWNLGYVNSITLGLEYSYQILRFPFPIRREGNFVYPGGTPAEDASTLAFYVKVWANNRFRK